MSELVDRIARILYRERPAIQSWNGDPYEFHEPGAKWERDKAIQTAEAIVKDLGLREQWGVRCNEDYPYSFESWTQRDAEGEARYNNARWGNHYAPTSRLISDWTP